MQEIAVIGRDEFITGFRLAGIRKNFRPKDDVLKTIEEVKQDPDIGIAVIEEELLDSVNTHDREDIEKLVRPVFIALSEKSSQENIRRLIKKSIGVDLMEKE